MLHIMAEAEFWVAVAFVLFLGVLARAGAHRLIIDGLDSRAARIKAELDEAKRVRDEAQAVADVRSAAADAAVAAAERILGETAKGKVGDDLIAQGIRDLKAKLN